jgi:ubiquinone/menaquinone biosynthesis C-methylase UbiE
MSNLPAPHSKLGDKYPRESAPPNFDRLAGPYRWLEYLTFGPWLARTRCAFLPQLAECQNALVLGDGDGRFTARLLIANSTVRVHAIDASPAMLRALVRCAGPHAARISTQLADARFWRPERIELRDQEYDAICTHFFLDCLTTTEIQSMAKAVRPLLSPSAVWVVSEFAIPRGLFGRFLARPLLWGLYRVFGVLTGLTVRTLPDHELALRVAGFSLRERQTGLAGLLVSELWSPVSGA